MQSLNTTLVRQIKKALWSGERQIDVAERFMVSQPTISYIVKGSQWPNVPWPDGQLGGLTEEQREGILARKFYKKRADRLLAARLSSPRAVMRKKAP